MNNLKIIKLVSGEDIVCNVEISNSQFVSISDPVLLNQVRMPRGDVLIESYILTPWLSLAEIQTFEIPTAHIILSTPAKESLKTNYVSFIEARRKAPDCEQHLDLSDLEVDDDSTLEDVIDDFINSVNNKEDENEEDTTFGFGSSRTIH